MVGRGQPAEKQPRRSIADRVGEIYAQYRSERFAPPHARAHYVGTSGSNRTHDGGKQRYLVSGPYVPMPPGDWRAVFYLGVDGVRLGDNSQVAVLDVTTDVQKPEPVATKHVLLSDLPEDGSFQAIPVEFRLTETVFGVQFRAVATGEAPLRARMHVEVEGSSTRGSGPLVQGEAPQAPPAESAPLVGKRRGGFASSLARAIVWPIRRLLDPRFAGLAQQADAIHLDVRRRLDEIRGSTMAAAASSADLRSNNAALAEITRLVRADMEATSETTGLLGTALSDVANEVESLRELVQTFADDRAKTPFLPPQEPWTEEYVHRHREFVRQVLDNEELLGLFARGERLPRGYGLGLEERVVEYPWSLAQGLGGRALDAGSTLNFEHVLDRFQPKLAELYLVTLAPEFESFPDRGVSYVYADLRELPFRDSYFESIFCISTLDHVGMDNAEYGVVGPAVDNPEVEVRDAMSELRRVLAPGGSMLLTVPYGRPVNLGWSRQFGRDELEALIAEQSASAVTIRVYEYKENGWQLSSLDEAEASEYHDYKQHPGPTHDLAAAARAVACVRLNY